MPKAVRASHRDKTGRPHAATSLNIDGEGRKAGKGRMRRRNVKGK